MEVSKLLIIEKFTIGGPIGGPTLLGDSYILRDYFFLDPDSPFALSKTMMMMTIHHRVKLAHSSFPVCTLRLGVVVSCRSLGHERFNFLPVSVRRPSKAFMKMRKSNGDRALPCATPVSNTIVALEVSLGESRTV